MIYVLFFLLVQTISISTKNITQANETYFWPNDKVTNYAYTAITNMSDPPYFPLSPVIYTINSSASIVGKE